MLEENLGAFEALRGRMGDSVRRKIWKNRRKAVNFIVVLVQATLRPTGIVY